MDKSLNEIMKTKWMYLNEDELKFYSLGIFIECICLSVVISIIYLSYFLKIDLFNSSLFFFKKLFNLYIIIFLFKIFIYINIILFNLRL